ncbi:hypothetical protein [Streptomyces sp. NPDC050416]|uniref:hypothetical protein n=1 Tax=Streptomyces sp. NPDC050416 TaxID=3365611 RepID=UPI00378A0EA6
MDGLVEFRTGDGAVVAVEAVEEPSGSRLVSRGDGTVQATRTFEGAPPPGSSTKRAAKPPSPPWPHSWRPRAPFEA